MVEKKIIRGMEAPVPEILPIRHVLASVFKKDGLDELVPGLMEYNPDVKFYSTGGTFGEIREIMGDKAKTNLVSIEEYAGLPEAEGGLVKTLTAIVHLGLLGERNNEKHKKLLHGLSLRLVAGEAVNAQSSQCDPWGHYGEGKILVDLHKAQVGDVYREVQVVMARHPGVFFDLLLGNFYDIKSAIGKEGATPESVRGHIDIGGPAMTRGAAKNFPNVATTIDFTDYGRILNLALKHGGIPFNDRFDLAVKVFETTAAYDGKAAEYFAEHRQKLEAVRDCYKIEGKIIGGK